MSYAIKKNPILHLLLQPSLCYQLLQTLLIIAVVFMAIITALIYKRMLSHAVSNKVIYEYPDNIKEESFHMTQSSVYEIHSINK